MARASIAKTASHSLLSSATSIVLPRWQPDFIIIGAQKSGTSSLYDYLVGHPQISKAQTKELHYFDLNYHRGPRWYRARFSNAAILRSAAPNSFIGRGLQQRIVTGEATPYYVFHPLVAKRVFDQCPSTRLIAVLRNPVDRAFSHYHHCIRLGYEHLNFEEAIDREDERLAGEEQRIVSDEKYFSNRYRWYSYFSRGRYADQLCRWFSFFPQDQLLILSSEELFERPQAVCNRVLEFLELPSTDLNVSRIRNAGSYSTMNLGTRRRLARHFAPHNQRLFELLGKVFPWDD